jgi:type I restriction enzyme, S subunit
MRSKTVELREVTKKIGSGSTPKGGSNIYGTSGIPFIRSQNVHSGRLDLSDVVYISDEIHNKMKGTHVKPNDVLLNITGASIGRSCVAPETIKTANVNQHVCIIRLSDDYNPEFLSQYINSYFGQYQINAFQAGGNRQGLNFEQIADLQVPAPPFPEQRKIAAILRTWDDAIEKYNSCLSVIREKRTLIIQQTLSAKKWPLATIADIADIIVSNVDKKSVEGQQAVRLCNYMDVFYNRYITDAIPFMEATASDREIATYALKKGDAVFTKDSETPEDIAVCASVEEDIEGLVCGYHLAIARPKVTKILGAYLADAINSPHVHHQFVRSANGATRFGLTRGDIDDIDLPLPPIKEQQKIIAALRQCDREKELTEQRIKYLQSQKRGLMQKLLTGAWRVQGDKEAA